jgi:hypothetical protein
VIKAGHGDPILSSDHHGDDVWVVTEDHAVSIALKHELDVTGIERQDAQCMVGPGAEDVLPDLVEVEEDPRDELWAFGICGTKFRESGSKWGENEIHRDVVKTE